MARKPPIDLSRPGLAKTIAERVAFSQEVLRVHELNASKAIDPFAEPWYDYEQFPWAHPMWASEWAAAERQKVRLRKRYLRDE
jgi:hypothetical protein